MSARPTKFFWMTSSACQNRSKFAGALGGALGPPLVTGWPLAAGADDGFETAPDTPPRTPVEPTATPTKNTASNRTSAAIDTAGRATGAGGSHAGGSERTGGSGLGRLSLIHISEP